MREGVKERVSTVDEADRDTDIPYPLVSVSKTYLHIY